MNPQGGLARRPQVAGRADMGALSALVKQKLAR